MHGEGVLFQNDSSSYKGTFFEGKKHGKGVLTLEKEG
jgi:hypothetical protein